MPALLPSPEVYKLLYASRLADYGLPAQALQYCEQIATTLLGQDPASHPVLAQQVMKVSLEPLCILGQGGTPSGPSALGSIFGVSSWSGVLGCSEQPLQGLLPGMC